MGEFITLLGPSGCGKTTTLRMIAGFEHPSEGTIGIDGEDIIQLSPDKRPMAMVFQSYALFPHMSVWDNVAYGLRLKRLSKAEIAQEVDYALETMDLVHLADRAPNQLSGGQQQRVALARAMVMKPKVLLFDEPLSNLDAKLRVQMRAEIRRLQQRLGITSIYVTHDQDEAMMLSDRIVIMRGGRIEQVATPCDDLPAAGIVLRRRLHRPRQLSASDITDLDQRRARARTVSGQRCRNARSS